MSDAVAAIIRTPGDKLLLQLRDDIPDIWYPGQWGCFGGAVDAGEEPLAALGRELREELELELAEATLVSRLEFDLRPSGLERCFRAYYLVEPTQRDLEKLVLHEGARMEEFAFSDLGSLTLTPYDAFALHLYWAGQAGFLGRRADPIGYNSPP